MTLEQWFAPVVPSAPPPASSVLVLAPHPDDEVFGCGGLLSLYRAMQSDVHVQVLTDGAGYLPVAERQAIFAVRQAETRQALVHLNVQSVDFSGYADRSLSLRADLADVVMQSIKRHVANVVLAPSLWEIHPDHLATARAAVGAVAQLIKAGHAAPTLMFYEIGAPQRCDCLVDITSVWPEKDRAMQCFASQIAVQNYARHIEALNIYRTYTLPSSVRYAEGYAVVSTQAFAAQMDAGADLLRWVMDRWTQLALAAATAHAETLQTSIAATQQHNGQLQQQLGLLGAQCLQVREQATQSQAALMASQKEQQNLLASHSWRVTAPLRAVTRWLLRQQ